MPAERAFTDEQKAERATFIPDKQGERGTWAGPWEVFRCEHGRLYSARWVVRGVATIRPTREDFESSEPEYGNHGCRKCHPEDQED